jgi:hypothetical protein
VYLRLPYRWQFMARLAGQALPDITGNSRGNMSRDPHFDQILGVLAALGAGPEHVSAVAQAYMQRPGPEPAERAAITGNNCAEGTKRVSLGRKNGSVAESMGRMVGKTPLPVEETESGTAPMGMPEATSGTPSPNPWDLTLSRQNVLFYAEGT